MGFLISCIVFGVGIGVMILIMKRDANYYEVKEAPSIYFDGKILKVLKRHHITGRALEVHSIPILTVTEHIPEQYIYTSATVGGITTGGVSKLPSAAIVGYEGKSGRYNFVFSTYACAQGYIDSIILPKEDYEKARADSIISKYTREQQLKNNPQYETQYSSYENWLIVKRMESKEDAKYIKRWISGK